MADTSKGAQEVEAIRADFRSACKNSGTPENSEARWNVMLSNLEKLEPRIKQAVANGGERPYPGPPHRQARPRSGGRGR